MNEDQRVGALHWIDHYVVPTKDVDRWVEWNGDVLGATEVWGGEGGGPPGGGPRGAAFRWLAASHIAGFRADEPIPASKGLGKGAPRYGFYIRSEDVEEHLGRLDRLRVEHGDPVRTSQEGEPGTVIYFQDPDQNQFEFWAPDKLSEDVMSGSGPLKVGRISHAIFESRDLDRTAGFYNRYCNLDPLSGADIGKDTLVMPLVGGARLMFQKVDKVDVRTGGSTLYQGVHTAYIVRQDEFIPTYHRVWDELDEWEYDRRAEGPYSGAAELPARTGMHGSEAGRRWKAMYGRGDQIYDPDTNSFHFVGGSPNPTMATYEPHYMDEYVEAFMKAKEGKS